MFGIWNQVFKIKGHEGFGWCNPWIKRDRTVTHRANWNGTVRLLVRTKITSPKNRDSLIKMNPIRSRPCAALDLSTVFVYSFQMFQNKNKNFTGKPFTVVKAWVYLYAYGHIVYAYIVLYTLCIWFLSKVIWNRHQLREYVFDIWQ